ncbi:MAG: ATP-binding protein [Anaerolineales bacterium]|nr:ATP-binding protein [Anaerolineales bacterium]
MEAVSFQVPIDRGRMQAVSAALRDLLARHSVKKTDIDRSDRAVRRLLRNIVKYSYNGDKERKIDVRLQVEGKRFFIETEDGGAPATKELQTQMIEVKKMMDGISHQYRDGKNKWLIFKLISNDAKKKPAPRPRAKSVRKKSRLKTND